MERDMLTDEQIDAIWADSTPTNFEARSFARAIIAAAAPEIRRVERERCAAEAVRHTTHPDDPDNEVWQSAYNHVANEIADAIRSLPDVQA
jgi:hypothetical protein